MKKENIVELNIGIYESIKLKINRKIALEIFNHFPEFEKIDRNDLDYDDLYDVSVYGLYKMANCLDKDFTEEKAREIFEYASNVATIVDGEKQLCDMLLIQKVMETINEVFTSKKREEVQVVNFKME